jgi:ubiquinone biosynthesis UbiH/UbiF/VisC/COQ6 family hydroxylase
VNFDIVIVGGGLVGASLAAALRHSGLSLALLENHPAPLPSAAWDSRIYAISPGNRAFLEQCGAWSLLNARRVTPVEAMRVFGDTGAEMGFTAYQAGTAELACILESSALQYALWQTLQQQDNLTLPSPAHCVALTVDDDHAALTLEDGRILKAKLVIGADGRESWVRQQAGISAAPVDYQQHGVVANFRCAIPHRNIAHQWFLNDGILALLPLPVQQVSMVWSTPPEHAAQLCALPPATLCLEVATAAHQLLGELQLVTPPASFPLRMLTLTHTIAPRIALIGDAAHNMHPLAGQGVNAGFRDARQLAEILLARSAQMDCGATQLLRSYERKRKEDIYSLQAVTFGLKHLFNNSNPLLRTLRNTGLSMTNRMVPVKKLLIQHALQ